MKPYKDCVTKSLEDCVKVFLDTEQGTVVLWIASTSLGEDGEHIRVEMGKHAAASLGLTLICTAGVDRDICEKLYEDEVKKLKD